jgi:hypothetical protein
MKIRDFSLAAVLLIAGTAVYAQEAVPAEQPGAVAVQQDDGAQPPTVEAEKPVGMMGRLKARWKRFRGGDEVPAAGAGQPQAPGLEGENAGGPARPDGMLEERGEKREKFGERLEEKGERLQDRADKMETQADKLRAKGNDKAADKLERNAKRKEHRGERLEKKGERMQNRGERMQKRAEGREGRAVRKASHKKGKPGHGGKKHARPGKRGPAGK